MTVKCDICGRDIQNIRALEWHKSLKHGIPKPDLSLVERRAEGGQKPDFETEKQQISDLKQLNQIKPQELKIEEEGYKYKCAICGDEFNELDEDWVGKKRCPECGEFLNI